MRIIILLLALLPLLSRAQTLEECQQAAERNYPLIRQYELIEKTTALTIDNIQKSWFPQVSAYAQATLQSDVTAFPEQMQQLYEQMGISMEGLKKDQYRIGFDVQQTVYDGGVIRSRKEVAQLQGEVQAAQNEVGIYPVRKRVIEMYFGLLLIDKQIELNLDLQVLFKSSEDKLASLYEGGTAAECDYKSVKAERLNAVQQLTRLRSQRAALARMLSTFCGIEIHKLSKPEATVAGNSDVRPELKAIDAQLRLADAQEKALDAAIKPKFGLFAQGFYGYPGYNMFEDMMHSHWSFNVMIGAKFTWNIGALYTRKNDKAKIQLQRESLENKRMVFLFNNDLEQIQENEDIKQYRKLMAEDEEIIALRHSVRKAAESKLSHGIVDVNDVVKAINSENAALTQRAVHEIEMLREVYNLKYTTNQ